MEWSEEKTTMRIEGTYTFRGASDRVFAALMNADQLGRILPGCERLIQLGPASRDGAAAFEARLRARPGDAPVTMTATAVAARAPAHLRLELRGRVGSGPVTGSGVIDLVAQEDHTIVAYVWDVDTGDLVPEQQRAMREAARQYIGAVCERLASALLVEIEQETRATTATTMVATPTTTDGDETVLEVTTPRGKIVKLPAASASPLTPAASAWAQRMAWMTTGMLIGVSAIGLLSALSRWLNEHER